MIGSKFSYAQTAYVVNSKDANCYSIKFSPWSGIFVHFFKPQASK